MSKWTLPDRKVWAGGLASIIAALVTFGLAKVGVDLPAEAVVSLVIAAGTLVGYLIPPPVKDIIKRVDDTIIGLARQSPDSPASPQ